MPGQDGAAFFLFSDRFFFFIEENGTPFFHPLNYCTCRVEGITYGQDTTTAVVFFAFKTRRKSALCSFFSIPLLASVPLLVPLFFSFFSQKHMTAVERLVVIKKKEEKKKQR